MGESTYIPLVRGRGKNKIIVGRTLVDDENLHWALEHEWGIRCRRYAGRATGPVNATVNVMLHREVIGLPRGGWIDDGVADHISGDTFDNRGANLRIVDGSTNSQRARKSIGKHGVIGVLHKPFPVRGKGRIANAWVAALQGKNRKHLGYFRTKWGAALAYDAATTAIHGEHSRTNASVGLLPASLPAGVQFRRVA